MATGSGDGTFCVWDTNNYEVKHHILIEKKNSLEKVL